MCLEERDAIFFGCGCYIRSPIPTILGIQPCTSACPPVICDPLLNGRPRFSFISRYSRFIEIGCVAHIRAGHNEIGESGREIYPTFYRDVQKFLESKAFDNNKNIKCVKNRLAFESDLAHKLLSDVANYQAGVLEAQRMREHSEYLRLEEDCIRARIATTEREAVERAAAEKSSGLKMGALRPQLGPGFAALALRKRHEEVKAHKALEETLTKKRNEEVEAHKALEDTMIKRGKFAQEARHVHFAPLPSRDNPFPSRDTLLPSRSAAQPTQVNRIAGSERVGLRRSNDITPRRLPRITDTVAPWPEASPSRILLGRHMEFLPTVAGEAAYRDAISPRGSAGRPTNKIASSRGPPSRPRSGVQPGGSKDERNESAEGKEMEVRSKLMTLDGVNLYE